MLRIGVLHPLIDKKKDKLLLVPFLSMAGLEPARISPHAPQTCAYTDSATSTCTICLGLLLHTPQSLTFILLSQNYRSFCSVFLRVSLRSTLRKIRYSIFKLFAIFVAECVSHPPSRNVTFSHLPRGVLATSTRLCYRLHELS